MVGWALLAEVVPLYPLYALLFAANGLSAAQISALFAIWSAVGFLGEVPAGALADRFSRRGALAAAGLLQAGAYAVWLLAPGFTGFAAGFVLWGLGGTFVSGAQEALLYDGLAAAGAGEHYARVQGRVNAAALVGQLPAAVAATVLYDTGGFVAVGWASVGTCLAAAVMASRLPEPPRRQDGEDGPGYLATLRAGLGEALTRPAVRTALLALALLGGLDAMEEYYPLLAAGWGVPTGWVPVAVVAVPLVGAAGAALAGRAAGWRAPTLAAVLVLGVAALAAAAVLGRPAGIAAVAAFYGLYWLVLTVADARLQDRITGPARATVTSAASLGEEVACLLLFGLWALGGLPAVTALAAAVALALPVLLRPVRSGGRVAAG